MRRITKNNLKEISLKQNIMATVRSSLFSTSSTKELDYAAFDPITDAPAIPGEMSLTDTSDTSNKSTLRERYQQFIAQRDAAAAAVKPTEIDFKLPMTIPEMVQASSTEAYTKIVEERKTQPFNGTAETENKVSPPIEPIDFRKVADVKKDIEKVASEFEKMLMERNNGMLAPVRQEVPLTYRNFRTGGDGINPFQRKEHLIGTAGTDDQIQLIAAIHRLEESGIANKILGFGTISCEICGEMVGAAAKYSVGSMSWDSAYLHCVEKHQVRIDNDFAEFLLEGESSVISTE